LKTKKRLYFQQSLKSQNSLFKTKQNTKKTKTKQKTTKQNTKKPNKPQSGNIKIYALQFGNPLRS